MAMSQDEWLATLKDIGIPDGNELTMYAEAFTKNALDKDLLLMLDNEGLKSLGVTVMGHQLRIMRYIKQQGNNNERSSSTNEGPTHKKTFQDIRHDE